jgi:RHS repeat-associated protein
MDEGRIVNTGGGVFQYEYNMQDHLGTNRVSFRMTTDSTLALSMVQNYYPFGQDMGDSTMNFSLNPLNFYKYNSKELQPELDLDTYDFGARHYDAVLGRWMGVDAMAVLSDDLSPYNYVENNPLNMLDPDGMQPKSVGLPQVNLHDVVIKPGNGGIGPGGIAGAVANGISGFIAAKDAFNINKPVIRQDWGQLVNVQGNIIKPNTQPTISQWQPGFYDKWKESGFLGKFTYDIADQADITAKTFLWPFGGINHLNGQYATPMDQQKSFAYTAMWFIPLGKGGPVIKAVVENVAERAVIEAGEKAVAKEAPQLLLKPAVAELTQQILDHIIERHWFTSGAQGAGKFASGTTGAALKQMIRTATTEGIFRPNTGGRAGVIAEYTFGKVIGTSSKGVAARSIRVVIRGGKVVTAFPF